MISRRHASLEELRELLTSNSESEQIQRIGQHVHQCSECRQSLEAVAAQSAIWRKAPTLLSDAPRSSVHAKSYQAASDSTSCEDGGDEWSFMMPVTAFLDRPSHPEMLGRIGKYDVEREIGRGGMGIVLKAHDAELNRPVAIKVLAPHLASHGPARRRFAQEAVAAGGILHPNVISVYGVNNEGKTPFIVMPFVDGPSLQALVEQNGPFSEIEIVRVALQISSGLAAAHSQGLVHRDIKPANILVDGGMHRVLITDFGLARAEDDASLTRTGWLMGTPNYMSPEQTRGQRADGRSDLFSLGSLMYFLASGRLPFRAETALGVLHRIQNEEPTPIRQVNPQISKTLADIIGLLLMKAPESRFQTATEVHGLLEKHLTWLHQPESSKPPKVRSTAFWRRSKGVVFLSGFLVLVSSFAIANGMTRWLSTQPGDSNRSNIPLDASDHQSGDEASSASILLADDDSKDHSDTVCTEETDQFLARAEETCEDVGQQTYFKACRLFQAKKLDEAQALFQKAIAYASVKTDSYYNLACVYARTNRPDDAFASLKLAMESGYTNADHAQEDSDLTSLRGDKRFEALLVQMRERRKSAEVLVRAKCLVKQGHYDRAEKLYREALDENPDNDDAATDLGYVIHMQGRIDEALPWHQRAANSNGFQALGNYNLACFHCQKGDRDLAFEHLNKAVELGLAKCLSREKVKNDPDLELLRDDSRMKLVLSALSKCEK
jgi:eukaryotic-like serine/threonine-protein kinase